MQQALHIFRKDARRFLSEILIVAAAALFFALFRIHEMPQGGNMELVLAFELMFVIFATLVIANVVHEDRIPGDTQFWITRNISGFSGYYVELFCRYVIEEDRNLVRWVRV